MSTTSKRWKDEAGRATVEADFNQMKKYCKIIRVICHTQVTDVLVGGGVTGIIPYFIGLISSFHNPVIHHGVLNFL